VKKLSVGQKKSLAEFFGNAAVAWLTAGVVTPFFATKRLKEFVTFGIWGLLLTLVFLVFSLFFSKQIKS